MKEQKELLGFNRSLTLQCILIYICMWGGLGVSNYLFVIVAASTILVSVFSDIDTAFYHLLFTLPFTVIYKMSPTSTSLFAYVMMLSGIILLFRKNSIQGVPFIFIILFLAYAILGMGNNFTTVLKMVSGLLLLYVFISFVQPKNFKNHILAFTLGVLGASIIGTLKDSWPTLAMYFYDADLIIFDGEMFSRFTGLNYDPNFYGISVILAIFLCVQLLKSKQGNRLFIFILITSLAIFGFISYSKMFLLTFCILLVLIILSLFSKIKSPKQIVTATFGVIIAFTVLFSWINSSGYLDIMFMRLSDGDVSTGRFDIWEKSFNYLSENPFTLLFGDGLGFQTIEPHNSYIELILIFGVVGGIIFMLTIFALMSMVKHVEKRNLSHYLMIFLYMIMIGTLGIITMNEFMFYCILLFISLNMPDKIEEPLLSQ